MAFGRELVLAMALLEALVVVPDSCQLTTAVFGPNYDLLLLGRSESD